LSFAGVFRNMGDGLRRVGASREGAKVDDADSVRLRANVKPTLPRCDVEGFRRSGPTRHSRPLQHWHDVKKELHVHETLEQKWLRKGNTPLDMLLGHAVPTQR
jgi:hypothetical protein